MPEPITLPTRSASVIHDPSIRACVGSSLLTAANVAGQCDWRNAPGLKADCLGHRQMLLHHRHRGCGIARRRPIAAARLRLELGDVFSMVVDHVVAHFTIEGE